MSIDEFSQIVGELKATSDASQRQRAEIFRKLDKLTEALAEHAKLSAENTVAIKKMLEVQGSRIDTHGDDIAALQRFRNRVHLFLAGTFGSGGALGWLAKYFQIGSGPQ